MLKTRSRLMQATVVVGFLAILGFGTATIQIRAEAAKTATRAVAQPLPVAVISPRRESGYEITERFTGRLEPAREADLAFERNGLITDVLVDEGDAVTMGQQIARLDTALLEAERRRLQGERAEVAARLDLARLTEGRQQRLLDEGHVPQQRLDDARLGALAIEGALTALDAAIERIDIDIAKSAITAPFAGTVSSRWRDPGTVVSAGAPVIHLLETGQPRARIGLPPETATQLAPGETVRLELGTGQAPGRIESLRPDIASRTRTVAVLVGLDPGAPPRLGARFGDTVSMWIERRVETAGFWLPLDALTEGERGLWSVMTVDPEGDGHRIGRETIEVLHVEGRRAFVRGTLRHGQAIVASGTHRIVPGQSVHIVDDRADGGAS